MGHSLKTVADSQAKENCGLFAVFINYVVLFFFFFFLMNLPSCTRCQRNISNNLKVESFFIWWECLGPQDGGRGNSISVALRKLLQGGRKGSQAVYKFATKGAVSLNIKYQISS